jgi:hypothetical protein
MQKILQNLPLSAVPDFVQAYIPKTKFYGTIDSVWADLIVKTGIGSIQGTAGIGYATKKQCFDADLDLATVDISNILQNKNLTTSINGNIKLNGYNFNPQKMSADLALHLNDGHISGNSYNSGDVILSYKGSDTLTIEHFNIVIDTASKISLAGGANVKDLSNVKANLDLSTKQINVNKIMKDDIMPTSLSANLSINADGIDFDDFDLVGVAAKMKLDFSELNFNDKSMFPFSVKLDAETLDSSHQYITFSSENDFGNMFSGKIAGNISLETIDGIKKSVSLLSESLYDEFKPFIEDFINDTPQKDTIKTIIANTQTHLLS